MSDEQKYKDLLKEQLQDLPVPDEEQAWQKMKQLLDRKEDDDRIVPPLFFLKTCAGWSLLFLVLLSVAVLVLWPTSKKEQQPGGPEQDGAVTTSTNQKQAATKNGFNDSGAPPINTDKVVRPEKNQPAATADTLLEQQNIGTSNKSVSIAEKDLYKQQRVEQKRPTRVYSKRTMTKLKKNKEGMDVNDSIRNDTEANKQPDSTKPLPGETFKDSAAIAEKDTARNSTDTVLKKADTKTDSLVVQVAKNSEPKGNGFHVGAGLVLFQQIPLAGQNITPYNYYGRAASLADYVPAPYIRLYKGDKWFIHADFRYGAPQAAKVLAYSAVTISDSSRAETTTTILRLKKTFYHQVPLSFHYTIFRNWTLGAGGMYSRFYRAVSEREVTHRHNLSGVETIAKTIVNVPAGNDSAFTASQLHLLLQTEYHRGRLGAGLRYTKGLQPFIRYTHNGILREEKNHALQFYIRYQFWQSKKQRP